MTSFGLIVALALLGSVPADAPTVVIVVGAEGTPEYGREFATWAGRWEDAARKAQARVIRVGPEKAGGAAENPADDADRRRLQEVLAAETAEQSPRPLWVVLVGHGTHDGRNAKFNLRGPDVSDAELAEWLKAARRPLAAINCSSSSAPFLNKLSGRDRVVITATRTGGEVNFARFGGHLSQAVGDPAADLDKDGQTSLLEAYLAASHGVREFYESEGRLETEHALLDDNGDGAGTPADWFQGIRATKSAKGGAALDGARAHQWHLLLSEEEKAIPAEVRARRDKLELEISNLRAKKAAMPDEEYYAKLEPLLLQLARVYE